MEENPTAPDVVRDGPGTNVGTKNNALKSPLGKPPEKGQAQEQPADTAEKR